MTADETALAELEFRAQKVREGRDLVAACFDLINDTITAQEWLAKVASLANCEGVSCIWWRAGRPDTMLRDEFGTDIAITPEWIAKVDAALDDSPTQQACILDEIPSITDSDAGNTSNRLIACLDWEPARVIMILAGRKDGAEWQDYDRYRFGNLLPALRNSLLVKKQLSFRDDIIDLSNKILDEMPRGFISIMPDRRVISSNKVAKALTREHGMLQLKNNRVQFADSKIDAEFAAQLAKLEKLGDGDFTDYAWYKNLNPSSPANNVLLTMKAYRLDLWRREATPFDRMALLILDTPGLHSLPPIAQLREFYQLTPAQARVVRAILQNTSVEETANKLNVSVNTVRAHLRAIYARLKVTNKSQLLRVISTTSSGRRRQSGDQL